MIEAYLPVADQQLCEKGDGYPVTGANVWRMDDSGEGVGWLKTDTDGFIGESRWNFPSWWILTNQIGSKQQATEIRERIE
jgi:hypothetical protein